MEMPTPRVALGQALRGIATSAIDVSDGLLVDLGHVRRASGVGMTVEADAAIGLIAACAGTTSAEGNFRSEIRELPATRRLEFVLAGGDDYELAFTAPQARRPAVEAAGRSASTTVTRIGRIDAEPGVRVVGADGTPVPGRFASFDHFG